MTTELLNFAKNHPTATTLLAAAPLLAAYSAIHHFTAPCFKMAGFGSKTDEIALSEMFLKVATSFGMAAISNSKFSSQKQCRPLSNAINASVVASMVGDVLRTSTEFPDLAPPIIAGAALSTILLYSNCFAGRSTKKSYKEAMPSFVTALAIAAIASKL